MIQIFEFRSFASSSLRACLAGILTAAFLLGNLSVVNAVEIQEVRSDGGIQALLVEDYTVPIISMSFSFKGGSTQDPSGQEGVIRLMTSMLDEGAGDLDSQAFHARLEEIGLELGFSAGRDRISGYLRTLQTEKENAFKMLRLALNEPSFEEKPLERLRAAFIQGIKRSEKHPRSKGVEALRLAAYGEHPYRESGRGSTDTIAELTTENLRAVHGKIFAREHLLVGVVGAISADELKSILDEVFGSLPERANLRPIDDADVNFGDAVQVDAQLPQANISFVYPGVKRSDKDFFAVYLVNQILGGGTFSSRLYQEVREKRGLAYSVSSNLVTYDHASAIVASTATRSDRLQEVSDIIRAEFKKMADNGPSAAELESAKKYIKGTYAISNLDTSSKIANVLVGIQQADLGLDYIDKRAELIESVTLEDAKRVAKKLFSTDPLTVSVGPKEFLPNKQSD